MAKVYSIKGKEDKTVKLPKVFDTPYRPDIISRAVLAEQTRRKQKQGRYPLAGRVVAAVSNGPGRGMSKIPRTTGSGTHHGNRATLVHSTVGGRMLFPPTTDKKIVEYINRKEHLNALKSAIAATADPEKIRSRGHRFSGEEGPLIVVDDISSIVRTKNFYQVLLNLGLEEDLARCKPRKVRAGKGKRRGRKYRTKTGPLIVVNDMSDALKAGKNIPGVQVVTVDQLSVEMLAPGGQPARLTVWTESALAKLEKF